jgi:tetratricopeptide (TPR) repeat protein
MINVRFVLTGALLLSKLGAADTAADLALAKAWNHSAEQFMNRGSYEEARLLYSRSLPLMEKALGSEDPATITTLGNFCSASSHLPAYLDAKPLCTRALSLREKALGPKHPDVARSLSDLGLVYVNEGDFGHAEWLLRRALHVDDAFPDSPDFPTLLNNFGYLYFKKGKYGPAENYFERAIASVESTRGSEDPALVAMFGNVGSVYLANHQYARAEQRFRQALAVAERAFGPEQGPSLQALVGLARAAAAQGNSSEAAAALQRAQSVVDGDRLTYLEWGRALEAARASVRLR